MIIFSGWGPLAILIYIITFFILAVPLNAVSSDQGMFKDILLLIDAYTSAYVTYRVGIWFKNRNTKTYIDPDTHEEVTLRKEHSLMGIPFEYIGYVIAVLISIVFIMDMFKLESNKTTDSNETLSEIIDKYGLEKAERKCENGDADACSNAGYEYAKGNIIAKDSLKAISLFKKACDGDSGMGCNNLGIMYQIEENLSVSKQEIFLTYKKSCDLKDNDGCGNLAELYLNGDGVSIDTEKGKKLANQSCSLNSKIGCNALAEFYSSEEQYIPALSYYEKACELGDAYACSDASIFYDEGRGTALNETKAFEFTKKACDLDIKDGGSSCFMTGLDYSIGDLVQENNNKANEYYTKACEKGHEKACAKIQSNNQKM